MSMTFGFHLISVSSLGFSFFLLPLDAIDDAMIGRERHRHHRSLIAPPSQYETTRGARLQA